MTENILDSTKKVLGLDADYKAFDEDIKMHINSVFSILHQLGVGPDEGFFLVDDAAVWDDFIQDRKNINLVKTLVYLRVRLLFDPPATSFAIAAMEKQITEFEWRLNVQREEVKHPWIEPPPRSSSSTWE